MGVRSDQMKSGGAANFLFIRSPSRNSFSGPCGCLQNSISCMLLGGFDDEDIVGGDGFDDEDDTV